MTTSLTKESSTSDITLPYILKQGQLLRGLHGEKRNLCVRIDFDILRQFSEKLRGQVSLLEKHVKELGELPLKIDSQEQGHHMGIFLDCTPTQVGPTDQAVLLTIITDFFRGNYHQDHCYIEKISFPSVSLSSSSMHSRPSTSFSISNPSWLQSLTLDGGIDLHVAMNRGLESARMDTAVILLRTPLNQNRQVMEIRLREVLAGHHVKLHFIVLQSALWDIQASVDIHQLSQNLKAGFIHIDIMKKRILLHSGVDRIRKEIERINALIDSMSELQQGKVVNGVYILNHPLGKEEEQHKTWSLQRECSVSLSISFTAVSAIFQSSKNWLKSNSLQACGLVLHRYLEGDAYTCSKDMVTTISKRVGSRAQREWTVRVPWIDGTTKHVFVNHAKLSSYIERLSDQLELYKERLALLSNPRYERFGVITEKRVVLVIDSSEHMSAIRNHLLQDLKSLLSEQIVATEAFTIICGSSNKQEAFQSQLVESSPVTVQEAWRFVCSVQCGGKRGFSRSFQKALEALAGSHESAGCYFVTGGPLDEDQNPLFALVKECLAGTSWNLNVVLYEAADGAASCDRSPAGHLFRTLADLGRGRFHQYCSYSRTGTNSDVEPVQAELRLGLEYLNQARQLYAANAGRRSIGNRIPVPPPTSKTRTNTNGFLEEF